MSNRQSSSRVVSSLIISTSILYIDLVIFINYYIIAHHRTTITM
jgi:hypothetical protein